MNKKEFFEELNEYLIGINKEDKEEILQDYREHFIIGKKNKRKESDIIQSLGEPKQIAREVRQELSHSNKEELKSEAIETWVAAKKLTLHLFAEAKEKIEHIPKTARGKKKIKNYSTFIVLSILTVAVLLFVNSAFFLLVALLFVGYLLITDKSFVTSSGKQEHSLPKILALVVFNVLVFLWIWISLLSFVFGFTVAALAITAASIVVITFSVFALISYNNPVTKDLLFSGLFAGLGTLLLGTLLVQASVWAFKAFFQVTKWYIQLNGRFIKK